MRADPISLGRLAEGARVHGTACRLQADGEAAVSGLCYDTRRLERGDLFLALPGTRVDGGSFVTAALETGAVAVMCTEEQAREGLPCLVVDDPAAAAGVLAAVYYGEPSDKLELVGITGTNGKTSCTYLLESVWQAAGRRPGVIGTIEQRCAAFTHSAPMTTPPAADVQRLLADMVAAGCDAVAMEVSSHALSQKRIAGCSFRAAVFTNLTRDHLDYHGDEESYFAAKASLFHDYLRTPGGVAVLNADDPRTGKLAEALAAGDVWTYSIEPGSRSRARVVEADGGLDGLRARFLVGESTIAVASRLVGAPNLSNLLAVASTAVALGVDADAVSAGLGACEPIPGRIERIGAALPVVLVDYAHTPDALERVLSFLRPEVAGRLICVFGCGGDRDRGKRRLMGEAVARTADVAVVTSDNPRTEDPGAIIEEILEGLADARRVDEAKRLAAPAACGYTVEVDRRRAIEIAFEIADKDDVVLVAGKGHEDYQEVNGVRHPFDDRRLVKELMEEDRC